MVLQDICHFSKALVSGIFFQVKRIWPEGVAFTKQIFYTAQTRTRWRFSFNVMKTRLFKFDNPNLEKIVYYFIMFVLEIFFEESDSIAPKITTKPIIRRQLSKFNEDFFFYSIFHFFVYFLFSILFLSHSFAPRIPSTVCGKFKNPNNQSNDRRVRLSPLASFTDCKEETFVPLCGSHRSPSFFVL